MQVVPSTTIHVVTSGIDWSQVVAGAVTLVAAVTGIFGTAWQAKRAREAASADLKKSIDAAAENQRAKIDAESEGAARSDKRRSYAAFQASLDEVFVAANAKLTDPHAEGAGGYIEQALLRLYQTVAELRLVAPSIVGELAIDTSRVISERAARIAHADGPGEDIDADNRIYSQRQELYRMMRRDLGVPLSESEQQLTGY